MSKLVTIKTNGGVPFTVAENASTKFLGLLNDLEAAGYPIKGDQSGGYNYRTIAGTNRLSNHAHGAAVDVNWSENPRGGEGKIPADVARSLAAKHGMTWGGDWKNPDPMHFEVAGGADVANGAPERPADAPLAMIDGIGRQSPQSAPAGNVVAGTQGGLGMLDFNDPQLGQSVAGLGDSIGAYLQKMTPRPPQVAMASARRPNVNFATVAQILANRAKPGVRGGGGRGLT